MAFPTTSVLDDFNRASLGTNWTTPAWNDTGTVSITGSTQLRANTGSAAGIWNASTFGPDLEVFITAATVDTSAANWAVGCFSDTSTTPNGYIVRYTPTGTTLNMRRIDAGASSSIKAATTQTVSSGDAIGMCRHSTTIEMWYKAAAGSWTLLDSVTDATYSTTGYLIGVELDTAAGTGRWDDFGGGTEVGSGAAPDPVAFMVHNRFGPF